MTKLSLVFAAVVCAACSNESESDRLGVGAACTASEDCLEDDGQSCLTQFKGGYCGVAACTGDADCPEDSACIAHTDGSNYCFRTCGDKIDCNANRDVENESNCSANVTFLDGANERKACVPPSSGI
ncbi:MAG: hypothetical protein AB7O24_27230 [Kofleriaceae bacterium]